MSEVTDKIWVDIELERSDYLTLQVSSGDPMEVEDLGWSEAQEPGEALRRLLVALRDSLNGEDSVAFTWDSFPATHRWTLARQRNSENVHVYIEESGHVSVSESDEEGRNVATGDFIVPLATFAQEVADRTAKLRDYVEQGGHADRWERHPFPSNALAELTSTLESAH